MPKLTIVISKESEFWLRGHSHRKGDLSRLVETALKEYIKSIEEVKA